MKTYNRQTRRYEEATTGLGKVKSRELCRGGKEHDYLLTLPPYRFSWFTDEVTAKAITTYYEVQERTEAFTKEQDAILAEVGLKNGGYGFYNRTLKHFICSVCGKRDMK